MWQSVMCHLWWPGRVAARLLYSVIRRTGFVQDVRKAIKA